MSVLLAGCGARTVADDYRDAARAEAAADVPEDDGPGAPPDVACPAGLVRCGAACVDVRSDGAHCGACGVSCGPAGVCSGGTCAISVCVDGFTRCGGDCVDTQNDPAHCGACNRACPAGSRCAGSRCEPVAMSGRALQIVTLDAVGCRTVSHAEFTGDDRGGIALGGSRVFYTGDSATSGFDLDTLAPSTRSPTLDGLAGEVLGPTAFTLASNRAPLSGSTSIVDNLIALSGDGLATGTSSPLSRTAFLDRMSGMNNVGIFAGNGRVIVTQGARAWVMDIARLGAGTTVTELAIRPLGEHTLCESWAFWGVAEFFGGAPWVAYVQDSRTIVRQNLFTGEVGVVARFENLSDMCSFTVSPTRNRWYFHHEGGSQFASGDETLGYCAARIAAAP